MSTRRSLIFILLVPSLALAVFWLSLSESFASPINQDIRAIPILIYLLASQVILWKVSLGSCEANCRSRHRGN